MEDEHERSLVAWANTFDLGTPAAGSISDFTSGDLLIPIAQTIVGHGSNADGEPFSAACDDGTIASGWAGVFSQMKHAGLIEEEIEVPAEAEHEEETAALAVTCLEALLRYTVGGECHGRDAFIRQIMSLDADAQLTLRAIILAQPVHQYGAGGSEVGSPARSSSVSDASLAGSPAPSAHSFMTSPPAHGGFGGPFCDDDDGSHSDDTFKSWLSPGGVERERAAPVGPKRRGSLELDMEPEGDRLIGATGGGGGGGGAARFGAVGGAGLIGASAVEVADLKGELTRLQAKLDDSEEVRRQSVVAIEAQRDTADARASELAEDLRQARRAEERATRTWEDGAMAVEDAMRAKHEREVAGLQERLSVAEEKALLLEPLEEEVMQLRDEVDVLKPAEVQLSKVEESLSRCRARLEELNELPAQLKREENAHAELVDRCVVLETEVSQIPGLRRQLNGYRRSNTEMEVASREQSRELKLAREEASRLSNEVQVLSDGSGAVRSEHQKLREELARRETEEAERGGGGGGIGEGMSEFNPEIVEELARLRHQNEQLAAKVDYNTVETIQDLEQKADDANRLADSFHDNLVSERELRATAETSLVAARARIAEVEAEIAELREQHRATVARMESEAAIAAATAAAALLQSRKDSQEALENTKTAAAEALEAERQGGAERLTAAERAGEEMAEGLREEMAAAVAKAKEEREQERAELREEIAAAEEVVVREGERSRAELSALEEVRAREKSKSEEEAEEQREEASRKALEAFKELAAAKRAFEGEVAEVKGTLEAELEKARGVAAGELAVAREETAAEARRLLEESQLKDDAMEAAKRLEEELSAGKQAALAAIERLKANLRDVRKEAAWMRQQEQEAHDAGIAGLTAELHRYKAAHTVDDTTYNKDADDWEHKHASQNALIADLRRQIDALQKEKRRLERERIYYWGQAEELRMASASSGRADPTRDADHAQLVEQTKQLIEENRELRLRVQEIEESGAGASGRSTRSGGRYGNTGFAAMRAEHESEVNALKEEKQDMLMKYHDAAAKAGEQERRCEDLSEEKEEMERQVVKLQLTCSRYEKKLAQIEDGAANTKNASPQKENRPRNATPSKKSRPRGSAAKVKAANDGGIFEGSGVSVSAASSPVVGGVVTRRARALRGVGNLQPDDGVAFSKKEKAVLGEVGLDRDEGTPAECAQS